MTDSTDQLANDQWATHQLTTMLSAPGYWTARAMQEQGSRFFQAIGAALDASDMQNRRRIYQTWPAECWDFYGRGLLLEAREG